MRDDESLLRSAESVARSAESTFKELLATNERDLYAALAANASELARGESKPRSFAFAGVDSEDIPRGTDAEGLGRRIFQRWSAALHAVVCDSTSDMSDLRGRILDAIFGKSGGGAAFIAAVLVASFGVSPAIAAIVSALLLRVIVAPSVEEICNTWRLSVAK
jgi:hypothetical protein